MDGKVGIQTDIETFMPQDTAELVEIRELRALMGSTDQLSVMRKTALCAILLMI